MTGVAGWIEAAGSALSGSGAVAVAVTAIRQLPRVRGALEAIAENNGMENSMKYDLIIDGVTIPDQRAREGSSTAQQVIEHDIVPLIGYKSELAGARLPEGTTYRSVGTPDERGVLIFWDRVRTVEVRIHPES